ncbi:MAG: hypothetical protein CVU93_02405 [Firmicutes bacterium HGW-Firmicutes-18]|nr:MAG: hypothetical protein CVU93_02405 [Firmicutes bacterium HGW-Firmicutes-18]
MEYMILFYTHSGAIKFDRNCKKSSISCELMPVPRKLSSNCSISAKIHYDGNIEHLIGDEIEKIFLTHGDDDKLIYDGE